MFLNFPTPPTSLALTEFSSSFVSHQAPYTFLAMKFNSSMGKESNKKKMGNTTDTNHVAHCILAPSYATCCQVFSISSVKSTPWQIFCTLKTCIAAWTTPSSAWFLAIWNTALCLKDRPHQSLGIPLGEWNSENNMHYSILLDTKKDKVHQWELHCSFVFSLELRYNGGR